MGRPEEYDKRDLACRDRGDRHQHESAEPLAQGGAEPAPQGRGEPGCCECHGSPSYPEDRRAIHSGIQYGNRTLLEVGDLSVAAGPPWCGRRWRTEDHRRREPGAGKHGSVRVRRAMIIMASSVRDDSGSDRAAGGQSAGRDPGVVRLTGTRATAQEKMPRPGRADKSVWAGVRARVARGRSAVRSSWP